MAFLPNVFNEASSGESQTPRRQQESEEQLGKLSKAIIMFFSTWAVDVVFVSRKDSR